MLKRLENWLACMAGPNAFYKPQMAATFCFLMCAALIALATKAAKQDRLKLKNGGATAFKDDRQDACQEVQKAPERSQDLRQGFKMFLNFDLNRLIALHFGFSCVRFC